MRSPFTLAFFLTAALPFLAGCNTSPSAVEHRAREELNTAGRALSLQPGQIPLPVLSATATAATYVRYALLNHPTVYAAFNDWRASVASIAVAGALPDPQITFQADITNTVMSLMPGVMFDLMASGKRAAMNREAAASAEIARRTYLSTLVRVAAETRRVLVELAYLDEAIRLRTASVAVAENVRLLAASSYATGRGMDAALEPQLRAASEADLARNELATLIDRRAAVRTRLKSTLGLAPGAPDPIWPARSLAASPLPESDALWQRVQTSNPELATMRAMVDMAVSAEEVAGRNSTPDFTAGLMTDVKQSPWMWRPTATMTLPIWRSKLAGQLETAKARREAAARKIEAETLTMAADFARMSFMVREADRMIAYIDHSALPNLARTRTAALSAFRTGGGSPAMIAGFSSMELALQTERLGALRDRELAVIDLFAMTADVVPAKY